MIENLNHPWRSDEGPATAMPSHLPQRFQFIQGAFGRNRANAILSAERLLGGEKIAGLQAAAANPLLNLLSKPLGQLRKKRKGAAPVKSSLCEIALARLDAQAAWPVSLLVR